MKNIHAIEPENVFLILYNHKDFELAIILHRANLHLLQCNFHIKLLCLTRWSTNKSVECGNDDCM